MNENPDGKTRRSIPKARRFHRIFDHTTWKWPVGTKCAPGGLWVVGRADEYCGDAAVRDLHGEEAGIVVFPILKRSNSREA